MDLQPNLNPSSEIEMLRFLLKSAEADLRECQRELSNLRVSDEYKVGAALIKTLKESNAPLRIGKGYE